MQGTDFCLHHFYLTPSPVMATQCMICAHKYAVGLWPNGNKLEIII